MFLGKHDSAYCVAALFYGDIVLHLLYRVVAIADRLLICFLIKLITKSHFKVVWEIVHLLFAATVHPLRINF